MDSLKEVKRRTDLFIPDELVVEIVSRLPASDAFRCRHACRRWRDLTSAQEFLDLQLLRQGTDTLILVEMLKPGERFVHFLLDKWWEPARTISKRQKFPMYSEYRVQFSVDGLIVLKKIPPCGNHIILNPTNGENVKIRLSREIRESEIFGVFFHPSLKEYCTLWVVTVLPERRTPPENLGGIEFRLLNLGPNPYWKKIKNKCPVRSKGWIGRTKPVYVDERLYWLVYDDDQHMEVFSIMEFDVNNEEWTLIAAPPIESNFCCIQRLLNDGGFLSMVEIYQENQLVVACISTLTNRSLQLWAKTRFCFNNDKSPPLPPRIEPIAIAHKQLAFISVGKVFVCNLEVGTIKKFGRKFLCHADVFSHVMTLASLKDCKSEFCMGYMGEEKCDVVRFRAPRKQILGSKCSVNQDPTTNEEGSDSNGKTGKCSGSHTKGRLSSQQS